MPPPERTVGLVAAIALHAAAIALLLSYAPARSALLAAAPIMVDLLAAPPAPVVEPKPEPRMEPPKPRPVRRKVQRPVQPPPVITAPVEAPAPIEAPPPAPPAPVALAAPPAPEPAPAPPPPAPLTQPIFNADYLDNPAPAYPALSRRIGEEGRVVLRVLVNPAGLADEVQVRTSSGHPRLDEAARTTVARWRFVPAKRGEQPVAAWVLIPISFRLEG